MFHMRNETNTIALRNAYRICIAQSHLRGEERDFFVIQKKTSKKNIGIYLSLYDKDRTFLKKKQIF